MIRIGLAGHCASAVAAAKTARPAHNTRSTSFMLSLGSGLPLAAEQMPGNIQLVDLAGAFIQPEQAHVTVKARHRPAYVLAIARAAEDLYDAVGNAAGHL